MPRATGTKAAAPRARRAPVPRPAGGSAHARARRAGRRRALSQRRASSTARSQTPRRAGFEFRPAPIRILRAPLARAARSLARGRAGGVLDALLHGRGWIALVGVLLVGIVFFNVDLLQRGRQIAHNAERASALKRENARLRLELARLGSSERIQRTAAERGLVLPEPGDVRYLKARPALDARRAARRITPPSPAPAPASRPAQPQTASAQGQPPASAPAPPQGAAQQAPEPSPAPAVGQQPQGAPPTPTG